jgi:Mn2+/Fe2+ NRAMP family transporter
VHVVVALQAWHPPEFGAIRPPGPPEDGEDRQAGVERSLSRKLREAPLFYGIYTVQLAVGAAVALLPGNAVSLVINAQVLNGFITPVLLTYILILANRRSVLGDAANGPVFRAVATLCVTVVGLLSAVVLVQTVAGWL